MRAMLFVVLLFALLFTGSLALAQEVTAEPTAEATPTPLPPVDRLPDEVLVSGAELLLYIGLSILAGGGAMTIILRLLERKDARDTVERAFESLSPEQQERWLQIVAGYENISTSLLDFLKAVTDKKPN